MGRSYKPQMLASEIQRVVSEMLIKGELKDPALQCMIGINAVEVTRDLSFATLYFTALSQNGKELSDEEKSAVSEAFRKCRGFLRSEIAKRIQVRHTPELIFKPDTSYEYGVRMDKLLDSLNVEKTNAEEESANG